MCVRRTVPLIVAVILGGCEPTENAPIATVRDSAGVRIVEYEGLEGLPVWTLAETPDADIGSQAETDPAHQFTQIRSAVRLSDGRIVVGDWGSKEVRYFNPAGQHIMTVGGQGEGPGELRFLYRVDVLPGDTVVVGGWPIGSRVWFDENGAFIRNQALGPWFPGMLGITLSDGSLLLDTYEFGSYGNTLENWAARGTEDFLRPAGVLERVSRDGADADTLGLILGERWFKRGTLRQDFAMHALPFTPIGLVAASLDHLYVGHTERPEVMAYSAQGVLTSIIRWHVEPVPVTRADRSAFEEEVIDSRRNANVLPHYRRWLAEVEYPATKAAFDGLVAEAGGRLWVKGAPVAGAALDRWFIFDPDGAVIAQVAIPSDVELLHVDGTDVLVKWTDELDVEFVRSFALER